MWAVALRHWPSFSGSLLQARRERPLALAACVSRPRPWGCCCSRLQLRLSRDLPRSPAMMPMGGEGRRGRASHHQRTHPSPPPLTSLPRTPGAAALLRPRAAPAWHPPPRAAGRAQRRGCRAAGQPWGRSQGRGGRCGGARRPRGEKGAGEGPCLPPHHHLHPPPLPRPLVPARAASLPPQPQPRPSTRASR